MGRERIKYRQRLLADVQPLGNVMLLLILVVGLAQSCAASAASSNYMADAQALLSFKQAIVRDPSHALVGWTTAHINTTCHWQGVTCLPHSSQVSSISLPDLSLYGTASGLAALA
eukprot:c25379_g1_i3 orf=120-464(+)